MPGFVLGRNVTENVNALRVSLGSVAKPLSYADFAKLLVQHGAPAKLNGSTVHAWANGAEPGIAYIAIMAGLAGVSFEAFALGSNYRVTSATGEESVVDVPPPSEQGINRSVLSAEFFDTSKAHELTHVELEQMKAEKAARSAKPKKRRRA